VIRRKELVSTMRASGGPRTTSGYPIGTWRGPSPDAAWPR